MSPATIDPAADELADFVERCHAAITRQSHGDPEPFLDLWSRADDVSIMAAIGGYQLGFPAIRDLLVAASKTQSFDGWGAENLVTARNGDLAVTVELEHYSHANGDAGMTLRATMVYRREAEGWRVIHRHGDVLEDIAAKW
jgi:ketosteroid isomerase-like protein